MPLTTGDQFVEALRQLNTNSPETARNVLGLGRVAVSKVVMQTKRVEETVGVNTVNKPPVASDTTPDAFTFVDQTGVALSSVITSAPIAISGITAPSLISVTGGEYSIAGGAWTSAPGTITNGQTVAVRGTSSATNSTAKAVTLTVGGVSDTFDITTVAATPNTPLVLGSINCTATVIQHGQTTTCQITPVDPDGIQSLRAEIDGVPVSVSVSGDTYSIPVSGLPAGTTDGILTSQNHTIRVYASGKKPDTSAESEQSTTATITVQCN